MSYSTKFASHFYGPFREAAGSAPQFGDRRHYQIDVRSRRDAIASSVRCANEGADLLMVKPGMTSLDLIGPIADATRQAGGGLSGQRRVRRAAGAGGAGARVDFDALLLETWLVFRRAGAAFIITYGARDARAARTSRVSGHPALYERARRVTPGGVHSPVRAFRSVGGTPVFFANGTGARADRRRRPRLHRFLPELRPADSRPRRPGRRARCAHQAIDDGWSFGACEPYSLDLAEWIISARCRGSNVSDSSRPAPKP